MVRLAGEVQALVPAAQNITQAVGSIVVIL